MIPLTPPA
ncbi:hypothetical protein CP061683_0020A, partial [Chlamydia psittaci 06-1683]